jgi:hypothetical protein
MTDLNGLKTSDLVALYNQHSGKPAITKWKRKVTDLVALLLKMKPDLFFVGAFEAPKEELQQQAGRPVDHVEVEAKPTKSKKPAKKAKEPTGDRGAIRKFCEEQLLKVKGTDEATKRPLGLPYSEILSAVTKKFPEAETSLNCLRWYATKMNKRTGSEKVVMPLRAKAKVDAAAA